MRPWTRLLRLPVPAQDLLLALFITGAQVQGTMVSAADDVGTRPLSDFGYLGYTMLIVSGMVIVVRRRWPVAVFVVTALASLTYYALDFPDGPGWLGLFVAFYTLVAYGDGRRSIVVAGVGHVVLAVGWLVAAIDIEPPEAIGWVFFRIGASVMSAALGESVRSRRVIAAEAEERAEAAERTREEEARARVDAERLRIAREVHDTVAHAIAIINVQAGVTAHVLDRRPDVAREALRTIEQTSARALREMRAVLGVLRGDDAERVPHPGLRQVDELAVKAREAGLDITVEEHPPEVPLPSAVESAAYRIVQESITNVIRHVGPTRVRVQVSPGTDVLEVRVTDEGRLMAPSMNRAGPSPSVSGALPVAGDAHRGSGITGMRERCRLLGGELDAGPRPGGGFEVSARLPLAPVGSAG